MDVLVVQTTGLPLLHDQQLELDNGVSVQLVSQEQLQDDSEAVEQLVLSDHQLINAITLPDGTQAFLTQDSVFIGNKSQEIPKEIIQLDQGAIFIKDFLNVSSNSNVDLPNEEPTENDVGVINQEQNVQLQVIDGVLYLVRNEAEDCQSSIELTESMPNSDSVLSTDNQNENDDGPKSDNECPEDDCAQVNSSDHNLKEQEQSLTNERPFVCTHPKCKKNFTAAYSLKAHLRTHTGEKPYKCTMGDCDKKFKTSGDLLKHVRTHTGERPFVCPIEGCGRSFTTSNIRKVHVRTHTGERPFKCEQPKCGKAFASSTNYKNHIRIHSGEKPYVCSIKNCGRRFTEYSSLYKHHLVHKQEKPYVCELCKKQYRQQSTLLMHKKTAHSVVEKETDSVLDVLLENSVDIMDQANESAFIENGEIEMSDFDIDDTRILFVDDPSKLNTTQSHDIFEAEENALDMALKELHMNYGHTELRWNY